MEIHQFYMALAKSCGGACKDCKARDFCFTAPRSMTDEIIAQAVAMTEKSEDQGDRRVAKARNVTVTYDADGVRDVQIDFSSGEEDGARDVHEDFDGGEAQRKLLAEMIRCMPVDGKIEEMQQMLLAMLVARDFADCGHGLAVDHGGNRYGYVFVKDEYLDSREGELFAGMFVESIADEEFRSKAYLYRLACEQNKLMKSERERCLESIERRLRRRWKPPEGQCKDCKYWQRDRPPFHHAGVCLNEKRWLEKKAGIYIGECGMCEEFARREKADQ